METNKNIHYNKYGAKFIACENEIQYIMTEMYRVFRLSLEDKSAGKDEMRRIQQIFDALVGCDSTISSDAPLAEVVPWVFGLASQGRVKVAAGYLQDGLQNNLTVEEFYERIASVPGEHLHRKKALPLSLRYQKRDPNFDKTIADIKKIAFSKIEFK